MFLKRTGKTQGGAGAPASEVEQRVWTEGQGWGTSHISSSLSALMVMPRYANGGGGGESVFRLLNGERGEIRKESVMVFICFEGVFSLLKETF